MAQGGPLWVLRCDPQCQRSKGGTPTMAKKAPSFPFYARDWLTDTELSECSPATRGIWMDLLSNMWLSPERGMLRDKTLTGLARMCRCTEHQMSEALQELSVTKTSRVTERDNKMTVVNRRMWREEENRKSHADRQERYRAKQTASKSGAPVSRKNSAPASAFASASASAKKTTPTDSADFLSFWEAYPRKVGKGAARRAWKNATLPEVGVLVAAIELQQNSLQWRRDNGQYIPHPSTWLNQERWLDEPATVQAQIGPTVEERLAVRRAESQRRRQKALADRLDIPVSELQDQQEGAV